MGMVDRAVQNSFATIFTTTLRRNLNSQMIWKGPCVKDAVPVKSNS